MSTVLHASAVAHEGRGLVLLGPSGSGKSTLALELIALGARLVADDQVRIDPDGRGGAQLAAPAALSGLIEARGIGLMRLDPVAGVALWAAADLALDAPRLPEPATRLLAGVAVPVWGLRDHPARAAVLMALLRGARLLPADHRPGPLP